MLTVKGLNAWYGQAQALFDVSLTVGEGELVVIQGLNGAGKSTLLQSLIGIGPRAQGRIEWQGLSIADWPAHPAPCPRRRSSAWSARWLA